jgi:hypothetical protein
MDLVTAKFSTVEAAIIEIEFTISIFVAVHPLPLIIFPFSPFFYPEPFLPIVMPLSCVSHPKANILPITMPAILHKISFIAFALPIGQFPFSLRIVLKPISFIFTPIIP